MPKSIPFDVDPETRRFAHLTKRSSDRLLADLKAHSLRPANMNLIDHNPSFIRPINEGSGMSSAAAICAERGEK